MRILSGRCNLTPIGHTDFLMTLSLSQTEDSDPILSITSKEEQERT